MASRACCTACLQNLRSAHSGLPKLHASGFNLLQSPRVATTSSSLIKFPRQSTRYTSTGKKNGKISGTSTSSQRSSGIEPGKIMSKGMPKAAATKSKEDTAAKPSTNSMINSLAATVRQAAPGLTEPYVAYGSCEILVKECARLADYQVPQRAVKNAEVPLTSRGEELGVGKGWWYDNLGLLPTFSSWAQITLLHMYMLTVRMRMFSPETFTTWNQQLTDHFFYMAEDRMVTHHNIAARMHRNRYLKDLYEQNRGLTLAYDQGLCKGDAVLAAAVWRNVCKCDADIDLQGLAMIVAYMRSVLNKLEAMGDSVIAEADIVFGDPGEEAALVRLSSRALDTNLN